MITESDYVRRTGRRLPDARIDALQRVYVESLEYFREKYGKEEVVFDSHH